jgi:hypothetical protein
MTRLRNTFACPFFRNPLRRRSHHAVALGDSSVRRRLGRNMSDHRVLVLDLLQHRYVLNKQEWSAGRRHAWRSCYG